MPSVHCASKSVTANWPKSRASLKTVGPPCGWWTSPCSNRTTTKAAGTRFGGRLHELRKAYGIQVEIRRTGEDTFEYRWLDADKQRVIYEPVKLTQEFRRFDFLSPWEGGIERELPGDEKATKAS